MKKITLYLMTLSLPLFNCYAEQVTLGIDRAIYNPFPEAMLSCDYCPTIVHDQKQYKMWHEGVDGIALSTSDDGIHWTLVGTTGVKGCHPCVVYDENGFEEGEFFYKMWFWTGDGGTSPDVIFFSQSVDGLHFQPAMPITQDKDAPIVFGKSGDPFFSLYGPGLVLYNAEPTFIENQPYTFPYLLFYDAVNGAPERCLEAIGLATSLDGIHWKRFGSAPILLPSPKKSAWDATNAFHPSIVKVDSLFHLFYSGSNETIGIGKTVSYGHGIGHATSLDGIHWQKDRDNPLLTFSQGSKWRSGRTYRPTVMMDENGTTFRMWFTGGEGAEAGTNQAIGYVTGSLR